MRGRSPLNGTQDEVLTIARAATARDWAWIREICCQTGSAQLEMARWRFFGEFWVGPYQRFLPEWTYTLRDPANEVVGYLNGCPDTSRLEIEKKFKHWPGLWAGIATGRYPWNVDTKQFVRRRLGVESGPESRFSVETERAIRDRFPAHLHINLRPEFQGRRAGDRLMDAFFADLRHAKVPGIHVRCGQGPLGFYLRTGFQVLQQIEYRPGVLVFTLGKRLRT